MFVEGDAIDEKRQYRPVWGGYAYVESTGLFNAHGAGLRRS